MPSQNHKQKQKQALPLKLLTANLQAGMTTRSYSHYFTRSWGHALALGKSQTLQRVAQVFRNVDIVGVQESDSGSMRSGFSHQTQTLAQGAQLPHWHHQDNRRMGKVACSGNGLLARVAPREVQCLALPGKVKGRGVLIASFAIEHSSDHLVVAVAHLSLGPKDRAYQLDMIADRLSGERRAVLMGDLNCTLEAQEMGVLWRKTSLAAPPHVQPTFPSWRPNKAIDHILATPELGAGPVNTIGEGGSDHLMVERTIYLPGQLID